MSTEQINAISKYRLSDVLCKTIDENATMQPWAMLQAWDGDLNQKTNQGTT